MEANDLLKEFKLSIGELNVEDTTMDSYYSTFLIMAISDAENDDISELELESDLGKAYIILLAEAYMNKEDISSNNTLILLKNKLAIMTKGDRSDE